jgi:uroporphyrin-III C-methyltransferase
MRHATALREAGARVIVVSPEAVATIVDLAVRGLLTWRERELRDDDLDGAWLVVAATGRAADDSAIWAACERRRIWCLKDRGADSRAAERGRVILVGGGPGDPGLLTVAGAAALRAADVVVTDRLAPLSLLADLNDDVDVIDVGKVPFGLATSQTEINRILIEQARAGRTVVRLKGGDSFVFGRGGEEMLACAAAGVPVSMIPGVTSAFAVPAVAGIPVTHRGLSQGVTLVSGHVAPEDPASTVDYAALARSGTTLVLLMAVATLPAITKALLEHGMPYETPAATIADGTRPEQRVVRAHLGTIAQEVVASGIAPPAVTVIGKVAGVGASELQSATTLLDGTTNDVASVV